MIVVALTRASERANERKKEYALSEVADSNIRRSRGCSVEAARSREGDASENANAIDRDRSIFSRVSCRFYYLTVIKGAIGNFERSSFLYHHIYSKID